MPTTRVLDEKIRIAQDKRRQHDNYINELIQKRKAQARKDRTRRLIERGAMLENRIAGAETLTNDQIGAFLDKTLLTPFSKRILAEMTAQSAGTEPTSAEPDSGSEDTPNGKAEPASAELDGGGADAPNAGASTARVVG